jgi:2'-5' RNA ligase
VASAGPDAGTADEADTVTVGVAIAIPQPHATVLGNWRRAVGDPAAELIFPHVTLLPPTPVPAGRLDEIGAHLAAAARDSEPFRMHLSGTGTFRPVSPVVFVQVAQGLSNCEVLERAVRAGPLDRELEFPYHPHVTVGQDVDDAALDRVFDGLADFVARFAVTGFVLFCRDEECRWRRRTEYRLGAAGGDALASPG